MDFNDYPPEAGQLVFTGDTWFVVASAILSLSFQRLEDRDFDGAALHDCTLLLPSPQQCRAAGLTRWDAVLTLPNAEKGVGQYTVDFGVATWHWDFGNGPDAWVFTLIPRMCRMDNLTQLEQAIQHAKSLQAWLAQWTTEGASNG